jgi:hypothetical protein
MRRERLDLVCECCGTEFARHQEYGTVGYIAHRNIVDPYNMACFVSRFRQETDPEEQWDVVLDSLDILEDDGRYRDYFFVMTAFDCMIRALRFGMVEGKEDYVSHPDIADFMEARREFIKDAFNIIIQKRIDEKNKEFNRDIDDLRGLMIK